MLVVLDAMYEIYAIAFLVILATSALPDTYDYHGSLDYSAGLIGATNCFCTDACGTRQ